MLIIAMQCHACMIKLKTESVTLQPPTAQSTNPTDKGIDKYALCTCIGSVEEDLIPFEYSRKLTAIQRSLYAIFCHSFPIEQMQRTFCRRPT